MPLSKTINITEKENKKITTFSGQGSLSQLDNILPRHKKVLLFSDTDGFDACGAGNYFDKLQHNLAECTRFYHFSYTGKALPIEDVDRVYQKVKEVTDVALIIAVGGGTVIDLAKIIAIAYSNHCKTVEEAVENNDFDNSMELVFVPTTAGTGSETTSFAVVYKNRIKHSIDRPGLLPRFVVLDPLLLLSLPRPVLNSTVLDALAQAIEAAWAKGTNPEAREYAAQAIKLIMENLFAQESIDRLSQLQLASHLAGKAINISRTTLPHSISYPITSHFGVAHGIAVFLTLPSVAVLNYHATPDLLQPGLDEHHIKRSFDVIFEAAGVHTIEQFIQRLYQVMEHLGFSSHLKDYRIQEKDIAFLAGHSLTKGRSDNNPRKMAEQEVLKLLKEIF